MRRPSCSLVCMSVSPARPTSLTRGPACGTFVATTTTITTTTRTTRTTTTTSTTSMQAGASTQVTQWHTLCAGVKRSSGFATGPALAIAPCAFARAGIFYCAGFERAGDGVYKLCRICIIVGLCRLLLERSQSAPDIHITDVGKGCCCWLLGKMASEK